MSDSNGLRAFARHVVRDPALVARLRPILDREAFLRAVEEIAGEGGFRFERGEVDVAMRDGQRVWLDHGIQSCVAQSPIEAMGLDGWTPIRAAWGASEFLVFWRHFGDRRFTDPFFYETLSRVALHPFNVLFGPCTAADGLSALPVGLKPSGFVFHMARCGSTLCAQALAAVPAHIVVSEAAPIRSVLRAGMPGPATPEQVERWLAGVVNAFGQPRFREEKRLFVKFMAADALDLPVILRAFPDVPWIFLYRDPLEILASQHVSAGADTMPGALPTERFGLSLSAAVAMPVHIYQSYFIAALGQAALGALDDGRGLVVNYDDLPEALFAAIPRHFGFVPDEAEAAAMRSAVGRDAKRPDLVFQPDRAAKRALAEPWREIAETIAGPTIAALDRARVRAPAR